MIELQEHEEQAAVDDKAAGEKVRLLGGMAVRRNGTGEQVKYTGSLRADKQHCSVAAAADSAGAQIMHEHCASHA